MLRWIFRFIALLVVLALIAVIGVFMLPKERLANVAATQLSKVLGREVTLTGAVTPSLYPTLGVQVEGLRIAGPDWAPEDFVTAQAMSVAVDARALLGGDIDIDHIVIQSPVVRLIRNAQGETTWTFGWTGTGTTPSGTATTPTSQRHVSLDSLTLTDATIVYQDAVGQQNHTIVGADATLKVSNGRNLLVDLTGALNGVTIDMNAHIENLLRNRISPPHGMSLDVRLGKAHIRSTGLYILEPFELAGTIEADVTDLNSVLQAAGLPRTTLPAAVREKLAVNGSFSLSPSNVAFTKAVFSIGPNTLSGAVDVSLSGKPMVTGNLTAGALNLRPVVGSGGSGQSEPASGQGWSKTVIDASALGAIDANIALSAASVDLGETRLGQTDLRATIDNSRLVLTLERVSGFGGVLTGQLVANNRNGLSVGGDVKANNVSLQALLNGLLGFEKLEGPGSARLKFLASGQSLDAIMKSLSGDGAVTIGSGELRGIDLARLFGRQTEDGGGTTIFDSIGTSFTIRNGQVSTSDLSALAPVFQALGIGMVDLGGQGIDMLIQPEIFRGSGNGIKIPVRIKGPWSNLRIYPDLEFLAKQELALQEAELKAAAQARLAEAQQEAEDRLKAQAAEALGLEVQEGQSLEDAARDALEDELQRGLQNLFGGN